MTVTILDVNEDGPVVTPPEFSISEGGMSGKVVGVIDAHDPDEPDNPSFTFVIVNSQPSGLYHFI